MVHSHLLVVVALTLLPFTSTVGAEDLARYRGFVLGSRLPEAAETGGLRVGDVRTVHSRPDLIQEIDWRPRYTLTARVTADPVWKGVLGFYNGLLYRVAVTYDRARVEGLTDEDLVSALSSTYGTPILATRSTGAAPSTRLGGSQPFIVAEWGNVDSHVTLSRSVYPVELQLIIISRRLNELATASAADAIRRDAEEAPQRDAERRRSDAADAAAAAEKARTSNKAAFRP